jgi:hypothetical protein
MPPPLNMGLQATTPPSPILEIRWRQVSNPPL